MKKKGFTLIELLAVIVILAIIALIATPLVLKYIEKSRSEAKVDSAYSFVRNLETEIANYSIEHNGSKYNKTGLQDINGLTDIDTTVKGENPTNGKVCLSSLGQVEKGIFEYEKGKYYVSYDGKKASISDSDTYSNFSCSGNVAKEEVPEPTKEINALMMRNYGSIENEHGIIFEDRVHYDDLSDYGIIYKNVNVYNAPITLFKEALPTDGNIVATIRLLDGSEKNIELIKNNNYWSYSSAGPLPYLMESNNGWSLNFSPNEDFNGNYSSDYHSFEILNGMSTSHGLQSITMLGTTLYFKSGIYVDFYSIDQNDFTPLCNDYTKLTKIIVNYEDGNQDIFNVTSNSFNADGDLGIENGNHVFVIDHSMGENSVSIYYKENNQNYVDDIFKGMPEVSTITFEENGAMTTYKVSDNPIIYYAGPGD